MLSLLGSQGGLPGGGVGSDIPLYGDLGEGHSRRRERLVQRPQARTSSRGKGPAEKGPGGVMGKPLAWPQAFSTELAPPSGSGSSAASLSPSALSGFTSSQMGDPGQAASLLSAFALGCLIPVWALEAPRVGAGPMTAAQM